MNNKEEIPKYDHILYGNGSLKKIIDFLLLLKAQEKYMDAYYRIPKEKEEED